MVVYPFDLITIQEKNKSEHRSKTPPDPDTLTWLGGLRLAAVSC